MHIIFDGISYVVIFVDDVLVFSFRLEDHATHVIGAIDLMTENKFLLNLSKCIFAQRKIPYLGHFVDGKTTQVNPSKLIGCEDWPIPTTGKQIQHFLGFVNYWRDNIPLLGSIQAPLDGLRNEKDLTGLWTNKQQQAYDTIMAILKSGIILHHADFNYPFIGASDASGTGIGGCVYQEIGGETRYISFYSRALSTSERNYSATRRELLALIFTLRKGRNFFYGVPFQFYTDHAALTHYRTQVHLSPMIIRWFDELAEFDITINHRPGILNILPDHISRLYPKINRTYDVQARAIRQISQCEEPSKDLRPNILQSAHLLGHFGADAMVHNIREQGYYWTTAKTEAQKMVQDCPECQRFNVVRKGFRPISAVTSTMPGDHIALDLAGPFPVTIRGNTYLFLALDLCTRFVFLRAIPDKTSATIAVALTEYCCTFGFPRIVQSDNGSEFVNELIQLLKTTSWIRPSFDYTLPPSRQWSSRTLGRNNYTCNQETIAGE